MCCLLSATLLPVVCYLLSVVCCLLFAVCCLPPLSSVVLGLLPTCPQWRCCPAPGARCRVTAVSGVTWCATAPPAPGAGRHPTRPDPADTHSAHRRAVRASVELTRPLRGGSEVMILRVPSCLPKPSPCGWFTDAHCSVNHERKSNTHRSMSSSS